MAIAKDNYQVNGATVPDLTRNLNFLLQRIADRMDQIEGIRGTASIKSDLDMNLNRVTQVAPPTSNSDAARAADLLVIPPTFPGATFPGDLSIHADIKVYDSDGNLIHSLE